MSKQKVNTRDKILDKALEMFNERGIEYVGLRELAAVLRIRVGNITYYFPTKDDLVFQIGQELARANAATLVVNENMSMQGFLDMLHQVFRNHYRFRCLLKSFVHLMEQNKSMAAAYAKTQTTRKDTIRSNIEALNRNGYLRINNEEQTNFLVSTLALISRFWISEAAISMRELHSEAQIRHYLALVAQLLHPYATAKAKTEMQQFLAQLHANKPASSEAVT